MSSEAEIVSWLTEQPLDEPVEIDGEIVYLSVRGGGAELGAYLLKDCNQEQLRSALRQGFSSAVEFDAGVGQSADGRDLLLTQWLPHATGWADAASALEKLLNQLATWRMRLEPAPKNSAAKENDRNEQRMRSALMGAR